MVLTVEPGIYLQPDDATVPERFRGIGVRIEDDVAVTADGAENLSAALPSQAGDVERWIAAVREVLPAKPPRRDSGGRDRAAGRLRSQLRRRAAEAEPAGYGDCGMPPPCAASASSIGQRVKARISMQINDPIGIEANQPEGAVHSGLGRRRARKPKRRRP